MKILTEPGNSNASLQALAEETLTFAKANGATEAEVNLSDEQGFSVTVRLGEIDTLIYNKDKQLDVTVYFGKKTGSASTTDIRQPAIEEVVKAACAIAKYTDNDPCTGLANAALMATDFQDLNAYHPWDVSPEKAIEMARVCEKQAMSRDKRLFNSEGAWVETHRGAYVYANTHGFNHLTPATSHSIGCALIARQGNEMERDSEYTSALDYQDLLSVELISQKAAEKTLARLGARKIPTQKSPVIFLADEAGGLISSFIGAISGGNLYRKTSFLVDSLGKELFQEFMHIYEEPLLQKGLSSSCYDGDGVATAAKSFVKEGVIESYALSSYSARQLGMETTANAGGVHNLTVDTHNMDLPALLKEMDTGFLVTELMGQGVNIVTGDYSRGAAGFWVEKGVIQFPVHEVTIAGNLRQMFAGITKIANDIDPNNSIRTGSILIDEMMIAGA